MEAAFKEIGHYRIERTIGRGGMASVYLAVHKETGQQVALKTLWVPEVDDGVAIKERFLREIAICSRLRHPSIIRIYEWGNCGPYYWYAMEYVSGKTLLELINTRGPLSVRSVAAIATSLAKAFSAYHPLGIVHRDIKPANIIINKEGRIKLMDFGLVKATDLEGITAEGVRVGTFGYMAPEVVAGGKADSRSDIYQLGVVMYEAFTARPAFAREQLERMIVTGEYTPPVPLEEKRTDLPADWYRFVAKHMELDPADRYQNAEEILDDLTCLWNSRPLRHA